MKKVFFISVMALCVFLITGVDTFSQIPRRITVTPSSKTVTRDVKMAGRINEIRLKGVIDVEYQQSRNGRTKVEIRGAENLLQYVSVSNRGGVLEVEWTQNVTIKGRNNIVVRVYAQDMNKISTMGTGDIRIIGSFETDKMELSSHGTGDIRFERIKADRLKIVTRGSGDVDGSRLDVRELDVAVYGSADIDLTGVNAFKVEIAIAGSGDVEIDGKARNVAYKLRGSGDIDAYGLRAENVDLTLSGSGDIECYAAESLRATVKGSGDIVVGGRPKVVDVRGRKKAVRIQ